MCGKVTSDVKQADCERNGLKALFELREVPYSIPLAATLSFPPNSSLIGWSRKPASNFCPQTDNGAATLLFIMDYCTAHDVPPLHRRLTKDLIEYLSMVHLWAHAIENTQTRFYVHTQGHTSIHTKLRAWRRLFSIYFI